MCSLESRAQCHQYNLEPFLHLQTKSLPVSSNLMLLCCSKAFDAWIQHLGQFGFPLTGHLGLGEKLLEPLSNQSIGLRMKVFGYSDWHSVGMQ